MANDKLDAYQQWQLEKYGNIVPSVNNTPDDQLEESAFEEMDRMARWTEEQAEQQLISHE